MRNPSKYLQKKCGTKEFWRFEIEFRHFEIEFPHFQNEFPHFQKGVTVFSNQIWNFEENFIARLLYLEISLHLQVQKIRYHPVLIRFQNEQFLDLRKNAGKSSLKEKKRVSGAKKRVSGFSAKTSFT